MNLSDYYVCFNDKKISIDKKFKDTKLVGLEFVLDIKKCTNVKDKESNNVENFNSGILKLCKSLKNISCDSFLLKLNHNICSCGNCKNNVEVLIQAEDDNDLLSIYLHLHDTYFLDFIENNYNELIEHTLLEVKEKSLTIKID